MEERFLDTMAATLYRADRSRPGTDYWSLDVVDRERYERMAKAALTLFLSRPVTTSEVNHAGR